MNIIPDLQAPYTQYVESKSKDFYASGIIDYAERFADLLEAAIAASPKARVSAIIQLRADKLSQDADIDGISGYMYGAAISILAKFWIHGEALRRWHNKEVQIGTEGDRANETGGVLNPALITIG